MATLLDAMRHSHYNRPPAAEKMSHGHAESCYLTLITGASRADRLRRHAAAETVSYAIAIAETYAATTGHDNRE